MAIRSHVEPLAGALETCAGPLSHAPGSAPGDAACGETYHGVCDVLGDCDCASHGASGGICVREREG